MAGGQVRVRVQGARECRTLARRLRKVANDDTLQRNVNRRLRTAARPVVRDLRSAVKAVQVTTEDGGPPNQKSTKRLRQRVARAIVQRPISRGVRLEVDSARFDDRSTLPLYLDGTQGRFNRWRHPTFGDRPWKQQTGQPWFFVTIKANEARFRTGAEEGIDSTLDQIAR